jgi:hypothetical protein
LNAQEEGSDLAAPEDRRSPAAESGEDALRVNAKI